MAPSTDRLCLPRAVLEKTWGHYGQDLTYEDWVEQEVASYYRNQLRWSTPWRSGAPSRDEKQSQPGQASTEEGPGEGTDQKAEGKAPGDDASPKGGLEEGGGKAKGGKAPDGPQGKGKTKASEDDATPKGDGPKGKGKAKAPGKGEAKEQEVVAEEGATPTPEGKGKAQKPDAPENPKGETNQEANSWAEEWAQEIEKEEKETWFCFGVFLWALLKMLFGFMFIFLCFLSKS